ncbi:MAG TPA: hypothetical protein PKY59_07755, partial [Pyrinomonadaceae bacterium]|nr:hypothetical protein [Pyrinomonadaceae bacterium]
MEITELLKKYETPDPVKKIAEELQKVYDGGSLLEKVSNVIGRVFGADDEKHELLTKETAEIGLLIINRQKDWEVLNNNWAIIQPISENDKRHKRLLELIPEEGFKSEELKNLLVYFFGEEKAKFVSHAWDRIPFQMYQTGYARRSFRAPNDRDLYFVNQLNFLINTIPQVYSWSYYPKNKRVFYDLRVVEQIKYSFYFQQVSLFRLWSAALDLGEKEVFRQMEDIIFNKDEIGKVTREIIKALLNSENPKAWQLVEKLLLAAQRQEGLRQTILEALDETSVGALKYMLKVIVKNKLARFSSVVRAVDVWAGFGWESEREKTVNSFLEKASEYLENAEKIPSAVKSANNMDVYMSLWAQGVYDVEKCAPFLDELYEKGNAEKRALALKFAFETQNRKIRMPLYYKVLDDSDLMVLAWALFGLKMVFQGGADNLQEHLKYPDLFEKLHKIVQKIETKEKTFSGKIFTWTSITFNKNDVLSLMIDLIGNDKQRLDTVLEYFDEMSVNLREKMTRHILKDFARYSWEEAKKEEKPDDFQRRFAFRLLSDRGEFMVRTAFNALQKEIFTDEELESLQNLLKRKGADFRGKIIKLLLRQPDEKLANTTENLLKNGDSEQRLAALDILLQLKKQTRLKTESAKMVAEFKIRPKISAKEEILLEQLSETADKKDVSAENGFGFYDVSKSVSPIVEPKIDPENIYEKRLAKNEFAFSIPFAKVKSELEKLGKLYLENKDFEYEIQNWDGSMQSVLLGNVFRNKRHNAAFESKREEFENFPLYEVWEKWFADSGLDAGDLVLIGLSQPGTKNCLPYLDELLPKEFANQYYYNNPILIIIEALKLIFPFSEYNEFMLGGTIRLFASLEESTLKRKPKEKQYYYGNYGNGWQSDNRYHIFYNPINFLELEDRFIKELWNLAHWRQFSGREENIKHSFPSLIVFCRAFENG